MKHVAPKIVTIFVYPPIPLRNCDWAAHYDGEEDEQMAIGFGQTERDAIRDLTEKFPREAP